MRLFALSINHINAPLSVREKFAFTKKKQEFILKKLNETFACEAVIVSTCNRCEFYIASEEEVCEKFTDFVNSLIQDEDVSSYFDIYSDNSAVKHLFYTASGLLSMIIGEDQILGQVKEAHAFAVECGTAGIYMNTMFRLAVTGAKRVKTDTELSRTPVSVATLAVKACINELGNLNKKNIMIIGATGKIGNIVLKDMISLGNVNIFITTRNRDAVQFMDCSDACVIEYSERYKYLNDMDGIISATSSPHLTVDLPVLKCDRKRIFVDLAVPKDINVKEDEFTVYRDIDSLKQLSKQNNEKKAMEGIKAEKILKKYLNEFFIWQIFYENKHILNKIEETFEDSERIIFRNYIYKKKKELDFMSFAEFIEKLKNKSERGVFCENRNEAQSFGGYSD